MARAIGWQVRSRVSDRPRTIEVPDGLKLRCYPRSGPASNVHYFTPFHDPAEMAIMASVIGPGDHVADLGANIGTYTLLMARMVGPTGRVVAAEPAPLAFGRLVENLALNRMDHVDPRRVAVGAHAGTASMVTHRDVSNHLVEGGSGAAEVELTTLDALAGEHRLAFVKIDVEGYEEDVLRGGVRTLASRPTLLLELDDRLLARAGSSSGAVLERLSTGGYEVLEPVVEPGGAARLVPLEGSRRRNVVAVSQDEPVLLARLKKGVETLQAIS